MIQETLITQFELGYINDDFITNTSRIRYVTNTGCIRLTKNYAFRQVGDKVIWLSERFGPVFCTIIKPVKHPRGQRFRLSVDLSGHLFNVSIKRLYHRYK